MNRILSVSLMTLAFCVAPCGNAGAGVADGQATSAAGTEVPSDVVARVGDQVITFRDLNIMLNSSGVVGISLPALGTPERDTVRITLLDRFISANLLYLDALAQGLDKDPRYQRKLQRFSDGILAGLYQQRQLTGNVAVTEQELQAFYQKNVAAGTELTEELRTAIEATLRRDKIKARAAKVRGDLRAGVEVVVHEGNLGQAGDAERSETAPVAEIDGHAITWGEVKDRLIAAGKGATKVDPLAMEADARLAALGVEIDTRILAQKARATGLDADPVYLARYNEFRKTLLINLHRENLVNKMDTSDAALRAYYDANRAQIMEPEMRKVQMVVVKTKAEADELKRKMDAGEMTMYQAALQYSIAPKAKEDLGEIGWVSKGEALPDLDATIFGLEPEAIGGPVETPAGWHLVKVLDMQEAKFADFDDGATRKVTKRKYVHGELNAYVVDLRKNRFPVEVYEDVLVRLAQAEANMVARLAEQAKDPSSVTQKRLVELNKLLKP